MILAALALLCTLPEAQALDLYRKKDRVLPGPFSRTMPAPVVFPAFHETVRDNPAALRQDEAWSFQALGGPNFSNSRHAVNGGAAWANGTFGVGTWLESTVGTVNALNAWTLGFSSGIGGFSGGLSVEMHDFTQFNPQFTLGTLFGRGGGSFGAISIYQIGDPLTATYARLGYGYRNEEAFNFEIFAETPAFAGLPQGVFRLGMASALFIDSWSIGFSASYGFDPSAGFTPGGSPGSPNAMRFAVGASKWLGERFNLQLRFTEDLTLMAGFTLAFPSR